MTDLAGRALTYPGVGGTRTGECPPGFHPASLRAELGRGPEVFDRASEALMTWQMHRDFGLRLQATAPRAAEGVESLGRLGLGPLGLDVPCRVVWAVEEPDRVGFGYGTLPGHPESGEEAFVLEQVGGTVRFTVTAFSRGARWYTRLAQPVTLFAQRLALQRYLRCLQRRAEPPR